MSTEYGKTVVDVHSLEDFRTALDNHHSAASSMLQTIEDKLLDAKPKLGDFPDGVDTQDYYSSMAAEYHTRIKRLKTAIEAAQRATKSILDTYKTAEARNNASAQDIARTMSPVNNALKES